MNPQDYAPALLTMFGAALQWLRARRNFSEWSYIALVLILAGGTYTLTHYFSGDVRVEIIAALLGVGGFVSNLMGGTLMIAAPARALDGKPIPNTGIYLPKTDSRP